MKRMFCDRCGNEIGIAQIHIWVGVRDKEPLDICEYCADAFYRFMGIGNAGYEKLDSEYDEGGEAE